MNTPSPNSMKRDPGRGSAYLSFLEETLPRFLFLLPAPRRLRRLHHPHRHRLSDPVFHRHFLPGLRNEPRGTVNAPPAIFRRRFGCIRLSMPCCPQVSGSSSGRNRRRDFGVLKRGSLRCLSYCFSPFMPGCIYYHDPLLSIDPSLGRVLQWFYLN